MARGGIATAAIAAGLAAPGAAMAASVAVETRYEKTGSGATLVYSAARGERNDVTVVQDGDLVTISDTAGIQPGTDCEALDASSARCVIRLPGANRSARFRLGDQADRLDARALDLGTLLRAGAGDDRVEGPEAAGAFFVGGPGDDELIGGQHSDRFESHRRDGSDTMAGGPPPPLTDAGSLFTRDEVVYYNRSRSVRVELDGRPNDGARREHDNLLDIETVWGSGGDDVLIGSAADEALFGLSGRDLLLGRGGADSLEGGDDSASAERPVGSADRLEGGAGPDSLDGASGRDLLIGGPGRDQLDGGRGPDRIRARDGDRDWVLCGRGFDRLAAGAADIVMRGCERRPAGLGPADGVVNWGWSVAQVSLIVGCPVGARQACEGTLTLTAPGGPLGSSPYSAEPGMATVVRLPASFTDILDAARQLDGAVASTAGDSARFGELPDYITDSVGEALGVSG